jgi:flagellar basal-body rod modification protein FlgD
MEIDPIQEIFQTNTVTATPVDETEKLGQDQFLRLFITQLQNQDPLNPSDGTDNLVQLAQFTALENQIETNKLLESLVSAMQAQAQTNVVQFIGHEVVAPGNTVSLQENGKTSFAYDLGEDANSVTIAVMDANGSVVRTIQVGGQSQGRQVVEWDGLDQNEEPVAPGVYQFQVLATNVSNESISVQTYLREVVASTSWVNGVGELVLQSGKTLTQEEILAVA